MENENIVFCTECGAKNSSASSFCAKCGKNLNKIVTEKTNYPINSYSTSYDDMDDIKLFVQKNQIYYQEKFYKMIKLGDKKSWNWSAFFLHIYWMLYRKMYLQAGGLFLLNLIFTFIPFIGSILNLVLGICVGMYSNSLYLDHIRKKLAEINMINPKDKKFMIMEKGGTNTVIPIVAAIILFILVFFICIFSAVIMSEMFY